MEADIDPYVATPKDVDTDASPSTGAAPETATAPATGTTPGADTAQLDQPTTGAHAATGAQLDQPTTGAHVATGAQLDQPTTGAHAATGAQLDQPTTGAHGAPTAATPGSAGAGLDVAGAAFVADADGYRVGPALRMSRPARQSVGRDIHASGPERTDGPGWPECEVY